MEWEEEHIKDMMEFYASRMSPMDDFDFNDGTLQLKPGVKEAYFTTPPYPTQTPIPEVYLKAFGEDSRGAKGNELLP